MNVFVYAGDKKTLRRLLKKLPASFPGAQMEVFHTLSHFSQGLKCSMHFEDPAVIVAENRKELEEILNLRDYILELRTILILPNQEQETFSKGSTLFPRFISYLDSNFKDVAAVLTRLIELHQYRNQAIHQEQINGYPSDGH